jgi:hypothetical protein
MKLWKLHHAGDIIDLVYAKTSDEAEAYFKLQHRDYRDNQTNYWLVDQVASTAKG